MRRRCGVCERSRPEDDTTLILGPRAGNYRRAGSSVQRRVCRECTQSHVNFVRQAQAEGRASYVNGQFRWSVAAREFDIDIEGLWVSDFERRLHENGDLALAAKVREGA